METFNEILLDVWRDACRTIELNELMPVVRSHLSASIPLGRILICRYDSGSGDLETIAGAGERGSARFRPARSPDRHEAAVIEKAIEEGEYRRRTEDDQVFTAFSEEDPGGDAFILALPERDEGTYLIVLFARSGVMFSDLHIAMIRRLREPFGVAVENDKRITELVRLREAAAADTSALLKKLSRKEVGDRIIGAEEGLKTVMERVALVAASDAPVLIYGETGTGKELIARTIHTGSSCADGPFIRVNCGAIPPELIDSQLFGHEKGAFTHAVETRKGWFEKADGGTLFLDEVGEMPLDAQVRLLRVLQDGWLERVGGKHPIRVSVRIVLATHRDLVTMVAEGTFREDLYYRISAFPIFLPALRDRLQDMRALAAHFAERSAIRFSLPPVMPTDKDIELLCRYHWPGNIRELGTVIDRAALLGNGASLNIAEAFGWAGDRAVNGTLPGKGEAAAADAKTIAPLDDIIAAHIRAALRRTGGRIDGPDGCARLLAVNPHTLRARMRKLEIDWRAFRTGRH